MLRSAQFPIGQGLNTPISKKSDICMQYFQHVIAPIILSKSHHNSVREIIKNKPMSIKKIIFC